jgi:hypothetical protein
MFRLLFFADSAETLRQHAAPLARYVHNRRWTADGMAQNITRCASCKATFHKAVEPIWNPARLDPRNFLGAANRFRQFVEREEYDVVYIVSPGFSFLARFALRNLRKMRFPRVVYSLSTPKIGLLERFALPWTDHLVVTNPKNLQQIQAACHLPETRLHLIPEAHDETLSAASTSACDRFFSRVLEIPSPVASANRRPRIFRGKSPVSSGL